MKIYLKRWKDALIDTRSGISLANCEWYAKIGSPRLFSEVALLSGIGEEVVRLKVYFPYKFNVDGFQIYPNFYVLQSLVYGMVLESDVISGLNLAINVDAIKIVGKRNNLH